jgi:hypothetical protein
MQENTIIQASLLGKLTGSRSLPEVRSWFSDLGDELLQCVRPPVDSSWKNDCQESHNCFKCWMHTSMDTIIVAAMIFPSQTARAGSDKRALTMLSPAALWTIARREGGSFRNAHMSYADWASKRWKAAGSTLHSGELKRTRNRHARDQGIR